MSEEKRPLGDLFKKVVDVGLSAAFMTEEAIRKNLGDLSLPKDAIVGLLQNAKNTRDEFVQGLKGEFKNYLNHINISEELRRVLTEFDIEVSGKISFSPKKKKGDGK